MNTSFKTFLEDLKERELYIPFVILVVGMIVFHLLLNVNFLEARRNKMAVKNDEFEKKVSQYWPLKAKEEENLAIINELIARLDEKFKITENIYIRNQSDFEIYLKGSSGIIARLRERTKNKKIFQCNVRTEGKPNRLATTFQYKAQIRVIGTVRDIYLLMKELERNDSILLEVKEFIIEFDKHLKDGRVILKARFVVNAYKRRVKKIKKSRRRRRRLSRKDIE